MVVGLRQKWRSTKQLLTAAAVSGRLAVTERLWKTSQSQSQATRRSTNKRTLERIEYHDDDSFLPEELGSLEDDFLDNFEEDRKKLEKDNAQQTLLQALQVEALWKACKIDLDRIVRRACEMILSGEYFFFPSHQSLDPMYSQHHNNENGWVVSSAGKAKTIDARQATILAAESMVMIGEIMVQQSKQGTSWRD